MREKASTPRVAALEVMRRIRKGDLADNAMERTAGALDPRDRAWLQELVYGTLRLRGRIDHLLDALTKGGISSLDPDVLDVLRLGAYQLLEMGSVPAYAAISQSVELVRTARAGRAAGLVNGVLQNLRRRSENLAFPEPGEVSRYLATWGSHPEWLVDRWIGFFGAEGARALVHANNQRPELYVRPIEIEEGEAEQRLSRAQIEFERVPFSPGSFRILPPAGPRDVLNAIPAIVQDPAASSVVRYADIPSGTTVLDLCAAPGGKAIMMGQAARYVVASDRSMSRISRLRDNIARLALESRMSLVVADAHTPPFKPADMVLLDAPCTGTGTLRRHPDGKWSLTPDQLARLVELQRDLLDSAALLVRPGGVLVYSTCSLEPEENEMQVEAFLTRHGEFIRAASTAEMDETLVDDSGHLRVLPQIHSVDGSFAARLQRAA